jgi:hypothetical protein
MSFPPDSRLATPPAGMSAFTAWPDRILGKTLGSTDVSSDVSGVL